MHRAVAVLGIVGLAAAGGTATAVAAPVTSPPGALICHLTESGTYEPFFVSVHGLIHDLNGHGSHRGDIIPFPGFGGSPNGQNMTPENVAIFQNGCVQAEVAPTVPAGPVPATSPGALPAATDRPVGFNVDGAVQRQPASPETGNDTAIWLGGISALLVVAGVWTVSRARSRAMVAAG
jgi:hypothetical protein